MKDALQNSATLPGREGPRSDERSRSLRYTDVTLFLLFVMVLALAVRVAIRIGIVGRDTLVRPALAFQVCISLVLILALYCIVWFSHGRPVWPLLGWKQPRHHYSLIAILGGMVLGFLVDIVAHTTTATAHLIGLWELVVLDIVLGPIVEESFFRGCLQPVISHSAGEPIGIVATATVFAMLHPATTWMQWICFAATGIAYGWIRAKSRSTAAAAYMHAAYNAALFLCQLR
jgi:membrane protease YdiL (CAAX protease family)